MLRNWGTEVTNTVVELNVADLSAMQREVNQGLMAAFINADLLQRAHLDVRTSTVLYDESQTFTYATGDTLSDNQLQQLYNSTSIRYWSRGC